MDTLVADIRYALRGLWKNPAFALAAIVSLAIGIGANTAVFSVASALLLHPLPYADADRLVILWNRSPGLNIAQDWFSTAQYFDIKNGHRGFEQVGVAIGANYNLTGDGEPERIGVIRVSSNLLPILGARALHGRVFVPEEDAPGRSGTAVLAYETWARRYGGDPQVIGRALTLNGQTYEIIGVLAKGFSLPREVLPTLGVAEYGEMFLPLPLAADSTTLRDHEDYNVLGKLKPGVTLAKAQAEMDTITTRLRRDYPDVYPPNGGLTFGISHLCHGRAAPHRDRVRRQLRARASCRTHRPDGVVAGRVGAAVRAKRASGPAAPEGRRGPARPSGASRARRRPCPG